MEMTNIKSVIIFVIGYFVGVTISNAIDTQVIFEFTLTNIVQFSFGYLFGGIIVWILLRKKRRHSVVWKVN